MISDKEKKVYEVLDKLNIGYNRHEHIPVYTVEEANNLKLDTQAQQCKNLFIRNRKGDENYLVILDEAKNINLKSLSVKIGSTALSFASPERLYNYLSVIPGSVTPFGLINDIDKEVIVVLDSNLNSSESISFHPNVNTATIDISFKDFERYLAWCGNKVMNVDL